MRLTMRFVLAVLCLWWLESSLAFVAGVTESITLSVPRDNHTEASTESEISRSNGQATPKSKPKLWDTSSTTERTSPASFVSTLFSRRRKEDANDANDAANDAAIYANLIDWNSNNLLSFLEKLVASRPESASAPLEAVVAQQIKGFVSRIASLYDADNPYHNFEHATHVGKSLTQLLSRPGVALPDGFNPMHTIQSDPLMCFSLVFAALIHDVEHAGVSNAQLIQEKSPLASKYENQSIAEQNSIHVAMDLLWHHPDLQDLRQVLLPDRERFEYLVTRAVLATDIADPVLIRDRQRRWEAVYGSKDKGVPEQQQDHGMEDARTAIAMEHLMQVVDVAHTTQSGDVNHAWNERLFAELKQAYKKGRSDKDPLEGWYDNELGFFDYYVIPLAKKWELCCGMNMSAVVPDSVGAINSTNDPLFGTTSLVEQARKNRKEWEVVGHGVVEELTKKY